MKFIVASSDEIHGLPPAVDPVSKKILPQDAQRGDLSSYY
jgi:hypothetical protein